MKGQNDMKSNLRFTLSILASLALLTSSPAMASIIVDPDNNGSESVLRLGGETGTWTIGYDFTGIGLNPGSGVLEVNADPAGNTSPRTGNVRIADGTSIAHQGELRIIGNGVAGSASLNVSNSVTMGMGAPASLIVKDGGELLIGDSLRATQNNLNDSFNGSSNILVEGQGSKIVVSSTDDRNRIQIGSNGDTTLNILDGGSVSLSGGDAQNFQQGDMFIVGSRDDTFTVDTEVNVNGSNSSLIVENYIGMRNEAGDSVLNVSNGGHVEVQDSIFDRGMDIKSGTGSAIINISGEDPSGNNSSLTVNTDIEIGGLAGLVGFTEDGEVRIDFDSSRLTEGGPVFSELGEQLFYRDGTPVIASTQELAPGFFVLQPVRTDRMKGTGEINVFNDGVITTNEDIHISYNAQNPNEIVFDDRKSILNVNTGGTVNASTVYVNEDGVLKGDGGIINANVIVSGGTVAPGASPGEMTINGDFTVEQGIIELEYFGLGLGEQDVFNVSGAVLFGENAQIDLLFGFVPSIEVELESYFFASSIEFSNNFNFLDNINVMFTELSGVVDGDSFIISFAGNSFNYVFRSNVMDVSSPPIVTLFILIIALIAKTRKNHRTHYNLL